MSAGLSAGSLIGIGSALIGGLGGSHGSQQTQNVQQQMDPRMVPYIFGSNGQGGLANSVQSQLALSQSPQRMQNWQTMMDRGMGLLGGRLAAKSQSWRHYQWPAAVYGRSASTGPGPRSSTSAAAAANAINQRHHRCDSATTGNE
jgi:hypothetical protein